MILQLTKSIGRAMLRVSFTVLLVLLVVAALYVSLGRQLTPLVGNYSDEIESRLSEMLSADVRFSDIEGRWERFGPRFVIHGLQISSRVQTGSPPILLDRVSVAADIPATIRQLRPVLARTTVEQLELTLHEQTDGSWRLSGFGGTAAGAVSPDQVLQWLKSLALFELEQSSLLFVHDNGQATRFNNVSLQFQSLGSRHVLAATGMQEGRVAPFRLRGDLMGNSVQQMTGELYVSVPDADYSRFLHRIRPADISISELNMGGELWLDIDAARLRSATWRGRANAAFAANSNVNINNLEIGWLHLSHDVNGDTWRLDIEEFAFDHGSSSWPSGGLRFDYRAGGVINAHVDVIDLGMASRLLNALAPQSDLRREVELFNPRGQLQNLQLGAELQDGAVRMATIRTNLIDAAISAHRGVPAFWGIEGFAELDFDADGRVARGFVEVDSNDLTVHLPGLFNDRWEYDRVNGRMGFEADWTSDLLVKLASGVIVAESEVIRGRAQFATEIQNGDGRYINLELMVGALSADIRQKSLYLPTAPGAPRSAQGILDWVNSAVIDGEGAGSGLIFRGHVHGGARSTERTLQMFYQVADGTIKFDPNWPALENLDGHVTIDNGEVDVSASAGSSLGIGFNSSVASVRPNPGGGSWLTVSGEGRGSAQQGLQYLQATPVTQGIGQYLSTWQAQGETDFSLALNIPLFIQGARPQIDLALGFRDNSVFMPEFGLNVTDLSGGLRYSAAEGLQSHELSGTLLGETVTIDVRADGMEREPEGARVLVQGNVSMEELRDWSGMPALVSSVLAPSEGVTPYTADLRLPVYGNAGVSNGLLHPRLVINSELQGVEIDYPAPFGKRAADTRQMSLELDFVPLSLALSLSLQDVMQMNLSLRDSTVYNGLVYFGSPGQGLRVRRLDESAPGISVLGNLAELDYQAWADAIGHLAPDIGSGPDSDPDSSPDSSPGFRSGLGRDLGVTAEVGIGRLLAFDETFENLNVQLVQESDTWLLGVNSESLTGTIRSPLTVGAPWEVNLEHLHLSRSVTGQTQDEIEAEREELALEDLPDVEAGVELDLQELPTVEFIMPRSDPLAQTDPRNFPAVELDIAQLTMAGSDFGSWRFTMQPDDEGVRFADLRVDSRGLRIGTEENPATFWWRYDGTDHSSELEGVVSAGNLASVLSDYGYAPSIESQSARFDSSLHWSGSPAYFSALGLSGDIDLQVNNGRFQQRAGVANSALRLISIINFDAVLRRLRFSDDIAGSGLAYDEIRGRVHLENGVVSIQDRLQIIGPSSLFQLAGEVNLAEETMDADLYITLPVSDNIPWLSGLAVLNNLINWQVAVGVFLFDQIFGEQVDNLTSAHYTLEGPWEGLEPQLNQVFSGGS